MLSVSRPPDEAVCVRSAVTLSSPSQEVLERLTLLPTIDAEVSLVRRQDPSMSQMLGQKDQGFDLGEQYQRG